MKKTKLMKAVFICLVVLLLFALSSCLDNSRVVVDNVVYEFDKETGILNISGTGAPMYGVNTDMHKNIKEIHIENGITGIGDFAFSDCVNLEKINIPNSVTYINERAFENCGRLTNIEIPNSIEWIGSDVFSGCTSLSFKNKDGVVYVGNSTNPYLVALGIDGSLADVTLEPTTKVIAAEAFSYYYNINSVRISDGITRIPYGAFDGTYSLTSVFIPNSVTNIGANAFFDCENLTSIKIPESVISIGENAFQWSGLTSVEIPESVMSIGDDAFSDCKNLRFNLKFDGCKYLGNSSSPYWILVDTADTVKEAVVDETTKIIAAYAFSHTGLTSIKIPNGVISIGNCAFIGCDELTSIEIPDSVTDIGAEAFYGCTELTNIKLPNAITSISDSMFYGCSNLTSIEIPNSVTSIGEGVFWGTRLTSVEIPNGVTVIGDGAFFKCNDLTIKIPKSVTRIGYNAFVMCDNLIIEYDGTKSDWEKILLSEKRKLLTDIPKGSIIHCTDGDIVQKH